MDDHDANPPSLTLFPASHPEHAIGSPPGDSSKQFPTHSRNLIILVSDYEFDSVGAARKVWELAPAFGGHIHFLGLCSDPAREFTLRRQLVTMSAMLADDHRSVDSEVVFGKDWLNLVKAHWHEGDKIVCFAEQQTGLLKKPLSQMLEENLNAKVYVLSGLYLPNSFHPYWPYWLPRALAWAGSFGLLAGFFWLDVKIAQMPQDWAHTSLLYISLLIEVLLIWAWNSMF